MTGQYPFSECRNDATVLIGILNNAQRPERPENGVITEQQWILWNLCWDRDTRNRPTMEYISMYVRCSHSMLLSMTYGMPHRKLLLQRNPCVLQIKDNDQRTILSLLAERKLEATVKLLSNEATFAADMIDLWLRMDMEQLITVMLGCPETLPDATDAYGRTALTYAVMAGFTSVVRALVDYDDKSVSIIDSLHQRTPLHYAADAGHEEIVSLLLRCQEGK